MSPLGAFFLGIFGFFLSGGSNATPVTSTHICRKYHISTRFLIKIIFFHFPPKEKISYFLEKRNTIFPDITKKIMFRREFFWKDHLFRTPEENIIFPGVFLRKIIFPFVSKEWDRIFGKKKYHLSWKYNKDHIPVRFLWKDQLFKTFGKRKYGFSYSVPTPLNTFCICSLKSSFDSRNFSKCFWISDWVTHVPLNVKEG